MTPSPGLTAAGVEEALTAEATQILTMPPSNSSTMLPSNSGGSARESQELQEQLQQLVAAASLSKNRRAAAQCHEGLKPMSVLEAMENTDHWSVPL
jgi:hypothetical protein